MKRAIRPITARQAERILGHRVDRRLSYAFDPEPDRALGNHHVLEHVRWSYACSGCYEGYHGDSERGCGCHECGYHGRVRREDWVPYIREWNERAQQAANTTVTTEDRNV